MEINPIGTILLPNWITVSGYTFGTIDNPSLVTLTDSAFTISGDLIVVGNVGIGTAPLYPLDLTELGNSAGNLKIQADVQGNVILFGDTDIDNAADGRELQIYRKAAEGDSYFRLYVSQFKTFIMKAVGGSFNIESTTNELRFQAGAVADTTIFDAAIEGEIPELKIYGFRTGDSQRSLEIGVGVDAADTASFDGLSNYYFDGNLGIGVADPHSKLEVNGAISSATATIHPSGQTDNIDVSGINTLLIAADGVNDVLISGFTGGVDGQILYLAIIDHTKDVTLQHIQGASVQEIYMHDSSDELIDNYGGWVLVFHNNHWHDVSHAKHV